MKATNKQRALLAMLQENMTTAQVVFFDPNGAHPKEYTYKVQKAWNLKEGDQLVVNSPSTGLVVVSVVSVDKSSRIDPDDGITYKWAVAVVDTSEYKATMAKEAAFLEQLTEIDRLHKKLAMLGKVKDALGVDTEASKAFDTALKQLQS